MGAVHGRVSAGPALWLTKSKRGLFDVSKPISPVAIYSARGTATHADGNKTVGLLRVPRILYYGVWRSKAGCYALRSICVGDYSGDGLLLRTWLNYPKCLGGGGG